MRIGNDPKYHCDNCHVECGGWFHESVSVKATVGERVRDITFQLKGATIDLCEECMRAALKLGKPSRFPTWPGALSFAFTAFIVGIGFGIDIVKPLLHALRLWWLGQ